MKFFAGCLSVFFACPSEGILSCFQGFFDIG